MSSIHVIMITTTIIIIIVIITISPGPCAKNIPCMSSIFGSYPDNPILVWSSSLDQKIIIIMLDKMTIY